MSLVLWGVAILFCLGFIFTGSMASEAEIANFWALDGAFANRYLLDMTSGNLALLEQHPLDSVASANGLILSLERSREETTIYLNDGNNEHLVGVYDIAPSSIIWGTDERSVYITNTVYITEVIGADTSLYHLDTLTGELSLIEQYVGAGWRVYPSPDEQYAILRASGIGVDGLVIHLATGASHRIGTSFNFVWSPDSRYIAYLQVDVLRNRQLPELHIVAADNSAEWVYTTTALEHRFYPTRGIPFVPLWSPDGQQLALSLLDSNNQAGVYLLNPFTGELQKVLDGWRYIRTWSPDGRYLLLHERISEQEENISLFDLINNTETRLLTTVPILPDEQVMWSPDGKFLTLDYYISAEDIRIFRTFAVNTGQVQFTYRVSLRRYFPMTHSNGLYQQVDWWSQNL